MLNGTVSLRVPAAVIKAKSAPYLARGKPARRPQLLQRGRPHHRQRLRGRVPGHRPVLPAGRERLTTVPAALGHGDLDAEDPGGQAPLVGVEDGPQASRPPSTRRTGRASASKPAIERSGRKPLVARFGGIPLRRQKDDGHHRPSPGPGHHPPQGAGHPAPGGPVRDLRARGRGGRPPRPQARRPRQAGTTAARVGGAHGTPTAQDPGGLPRPATTPSTGSQRRCSRQ